MSRRLSSYLLLGILSFCSLSVAQTTTLTVATASDLAALQPNLANAFRKNEPNVTVRFVTGASGVLTQQIENGAPYDVFLSANAQFVDRLSSFRKLLPESVESYAVGQVAILWRDGKQHPLSHLRDPEVRFVALANPKLAPYGLAARQALEHEHLWQFVSQKAVYGENVRQALQLLESGNADAVLTSDSLLQGKNAQVLPADWHQPIVQKGGIVASSKNQAAAERFLRFLVSPEGHAVFARFGFAKP